MPLDSPICFKQLQHLEQEGAVQPDLSCFGKKICIYGHTAMESNFIYASCQYWFTLISIQQTALYVLAQRLDQA